VSKKKEANHRTCVQCSNPIPVEKRSGTKFCSRKCLGKADRARHPNRRYQLSDAQRQKKRQNESARKARLRVPVLPRACAGCGKTWTPKRNRARYCTNRCSTKTWQNGIGKEKYKKAVARFNATDKAKAWRLAEQERAKAKKYGLTVDRMREILAAGCYAPHCKTTGGGKTGLHIDHDHSHCAGKKSCGSCVRGALCSFHNIYLAYLEKDWLFALWAVRNPMLTIKVRRQA